MSDRASINFDRLAAIYDETRGGLVRGRSYARTIAAHLRPGPVLEIGVGTGSIALPLTELGQLVVGTDISPNMLAMARERLGSRIVLGDAMRMPFADASVRNAVAVWVFQLVASVKATMQEARRVLSQGGRFVVIPSKGEFDPDDMHDVQVDFAEIIRGARQDDPEALVAAAGSAGLRLLESTFTEVQRFEESPNRVAAHIERRGYSILLDLGDDDWQRVVVPVITALRALPEPDRKRVRRTRNHVLVFEAV